MKKDHTDYGKTVGEAFTALATAMTGVAEVLQETLDTILDTPFSTLFPPYGDSPPGQEESHLEWGVRLQKGGFLDNPRTRWEYQKATFRWLFVSWWRK